MASLLAGVYATSPNIYSWNEKSEKEFYDGIKESVPHITGLELPFWGEGLHPHSDEFLLREFSKDWIASLTCVPATMNGIAKNAMFGLASLDEEQRQLAVETHKLAARSVQKMNEHFGKKVFHWVQMATGPGFQFGEKKSSKESLLKSLEELLNEDWQGASLCLEHCDSPKEGHQPVKGLLALDDELWAINKLDDQLGMVINWGRSAIEERSAQGSLQHLKRCRGKLRGFMFSGTSDQESSSYGPWKDNHAPFGKIEGSEFPEETSLLGASEVKECVQECFHEDNKDFEFIGFKVLHEPMDSSPMLNRIGVNRDAANIVKRALL